MAKKSPTVTNHLQVQNLPISSLKPADYNPRKISSEQMASLKRSLTEFGFVDPIIVNSRTGNIVGGHQRVAAAKALGWDTVPVIEIDLDDAKEKALNVGLNKIHGEWNFPRLKDLLEELDTGEFDLELTGWTGEELERLFTEIPTAEDLLQAEPGDTKGLGNPVVQYTIIFDDETQQDAWYDLLKRLKDHYPNAETIGERLYLLAGTVELA